MANKEGGQLSVVKSIPEASSKQ
ncbi:hypothetical protein LINPERPRIM_LOCUS1949 [Linum perenne]